MKIYRVGPKVPPYKLHKSGLGPWGPHHFSLSPLKKRVTVVKEKAFAAMWFVSMKCTKANLKHRLAFLRLKLTVSFFSLPCKRLEKYPKSLENKAFSAISCKIVISDKW